MRIDAIVAAMALVERIDPLPDWPVRVRRARLSRERAFALGRPALAEAECALLDDWLTLVQAPPSSARPAGWRELLAPGPAGPRGAVLACSGPRNTLAWYRGLGFAGAARTLAADEVELALSAGQCLRLVNAEAPAGSGWAPLLLGFARLDPAGRRVSLPPRLLAGPAGELIELL